LIIKPKQKKRHFQPCPPILLAVLALGTFIRSAPAPQIPTPVQAAAAHHPEITPRAELVVRQEDGDPEQVKTPTHSGTAYTAEIHTSLAQEYKDLRAHVAVPEADAPTVIYPRSLPLLGALGFALYAKICKTFMT
jgi:hypothetical protein